MSRYSALQSEWAMLLARRASIRDSLSIYEGILEAWSRWPDDRIVPLHWSSEECQERWERSSSLIVDAPPPCSLAAIEDLLASILELAAGLGEDVAQMVDRFATELRRESVELMELLPGLGKEGPASLQQASGCSADLLAFITHSTLRPMLETYFSEVRSLFTPELWDRGNCPFCGGPPAVSDVGEDGKRRLVCHLCGGTWNLSRLRCPFCDNRNPKSLTRLLAEGAEEGYLVEACDLCRGYIKGIDRRLRWDVVSPLLEDWGSPHLDLIACRQGYWRATPSLVQLFHSE